MRRSTQNPELLQLRRTDCMSSGFASLRIRLSPERHFIGNGRFLRARQCTFCCWKYHVVFNPNVLVINDGEIADGLPKSPSLGLWKMPPVER
jgi:hypothetical protein